LSASYREAGIRKTSPRADMPKTPERKKKRRKQKTPTTSSSWSGVIGHFLGRPRVFDTRSAGSGIPQNRNENAVGKIDFGSLRRLKPVSKRWGFDRGTPVDRYYIESFLERNSSDIRGKVLEVKGRDYTQKFGEDQAEISHVIDIDSSNREANIVTDLTTCAGIESDQYDCVIVTQTFQYIYRLDSAFRSLHRILKPGGTILITCPGISRIEYKNQGETTFWSFTQSSLKRLLSEEFEDVTVSAFGNVLAASAFLYGIASEELHVDELNYHDPDYPLLLTARATK
jgi:SAM-dependent methyltransferase